jgi:hypothetical protein
MRDKWPGTLFVLASFLLAACAHDFGSFEPDDGGAKAERAGPADGGQPAVDAGVDAKADVVDETSPGDAAVDGSCTPSQACLDTAMSCADQCSETEMSCDAACGGHFRCMKMCALAAMTCDAQCISTCSSCAEGAGCPAAEACQTAVGTGP